MSARLAIRERKSALVWFAFACAVAGTLLLVVGPAVLLALGALAVGVPLGLAVYRRRRPERRLADVRVTPAGVHVDGALRIPRSNIRSGYFQPHDSATQRSLFQLVDKHGVTVFEAETDAELAAAMLAALGLGASGERATFLVLPALLHRKLVRLAMIVSLLAVGVLLAASGADIGPREMFVLVLVLFPFTVLLSMNLVVGIDGVDIRWLGRTRFIPMSDVIDVEPEGELGVRIRRRGAADELVFLGIGKNRATSDRRNVVLTRIKESLAMFHQRSAPVDATALLARGSRSNEAWLTALRRLADGVASYRETVLRQEDLLHILDNPAASEDARAGAALLLQRAKASEGRSRIRVASAATASPKLRIALDALAQGDDATIERSFTDLTTASEAARRAKDP